VASEIDWTVFSGPADHRPSDVPRALAALADAADAIHAEVAYHQMLSAIGNDHRGTLYPAAAASMLIELALAEQRWTRWAATQVLIDMMTSFEPEPGFDIVRSADGTSVDVRHVVRSQISAAARDVRVLIAAEPESEVRSATVALLAVVADDG
jgi:hypothetical protein